MENEEIVEGIPSETTDSDEDFFAEVDNEVINEGIDEAEEQDEGREESNETQIPTEDSKADSETPEVDYKPLLDALKGKIKYNKEDHEVPSIEDLIENYQKGLNYDKKLQELENLQNSKLEKYAKEKADALGISVDEYMDRVERYEEDQKRQQEQSELDELVNAGMPDTLARELIAGREQRKQLQRELNEIKEEREAAKKEAAKNKEYEDFLNEFPDVKASEIPKEVFEEAEKTSLSNAYMKWKMKEMETQISILKTNEKNKNSAVGGVTSTGPTNEKHEKDFFLEGFLE
jgi:hypothetical protein